MNEDSTIHLRDDFINLVGVRCRGDSNAYAASNTPNDHTYHRGNIYPRCLEPHPGNNPVGDVTDRGDQANRDNTAE